MPTRKKATRKQNGKGALGDVAKFIKDHKLISKGLGMIPHPAGQAASYVASLVGLGRKHRCKTTKKRATTVKRRTTKKRAPQHGRGIFSDIGGGVGNIFGGLGGGIGSVAHGLFGSGRGKRKAPVKRKNVVSI